MLRPSAVLWGIEEVHAEWLHDLHHPTVDRRYDVCQRLMRGESPQRLRAMSRTELDTYLDAPEKGQEHEKGNHE
jgi:hypothetical protein